MTTGPEITKAIGWLALALSVTVVLMFAALRVASMLQAPPPTAAFDLRYLQQPLASLLHILPGMVFLLLAPLQFVPALRRNHRALHRRLGWVLVACAGLSGVFALVAGFPLPAFGGLATQSAAVFFGGIFLFSLGRAIWHIRHQRVSRHREWMIRVLALALGAATIRGFIGVFTGLAGVPFDDAFVASFWLGFSVNLLLAEGWIQRTRAIAR